MLNQETNPAEIIESLNQQVVLLKAENEKLLNILIHLKKEKFGSKSERFEVDSSQLIFNEIEESAKLPAPPDTEVVTYTRRKQGKGKRRPMPENLPREEVVIDLSEAEKVCPHDGTRLECIGEVVTEKLKTVPAVTTVIIEKRLKYACPCCKEHMAQARSESILPGTIATPELLSFIIFSKFFQGLPLYRLEEFYKLSRIDLSRGTMARWMVQVAEKLLPIWNLLEEKALASGYMTIDATSVQVLKKQIAKLRPNPRCGCGAPPSLGSSYLTMTCLGEKPLRRDWSLITKGLCRPMPILATSI